MNVLVVGAGAIGGYVGAKLIDSGESVRFLVRGKRLADLEAHGLRIVSPLGRFSAPVTAVKATDGPAPDLIILASKAFSFDSALAAVAPVIGETTRILPVLNGIRHLDLLQEQYGADRVLGGIAHGAVTLRDDGVIEHLNPFFVLTFGALAPASTQFAGDLAARLGKTGTDARASTHIRLEMWEKFSFLATLAGSTCLFRANIGTILATNEGRAILNELFEECLAVAAAEGYAPRKEVVDTYRGVLTELGSKLTASMLRDVLGGHPTEADHILGDLLARARARGIATPLLRVAYTHLQCYEAARNGARDQPGKA
jgi:2-dehydropantoate 2-reductase